jgi:hypothetical protein
MKPRTTQRRLVDYVVNQVLKDVDVADAKKPMETDELLSEYVCALLVTVDGTLSSMFVDIDDLAQNDEQDNACYLYSSRNYYIEIYNVSMSMKGLARYNTIASLIAGRDIYGDVMLVDAVYDLSEADIKNILMMRRNICLKYEAALEEARIYDIDKALEQRN